MPSGRADPDAVWLNGQFVPTERAIAANDRGLLLADGVFDTALVLGGRVFCGTAHRDRLARAAQTLGIAIERETIDDAMTALAALRIDGAMRLTLSRGPGPRGLTPPAEPHPTFFGSTAPLAPALMFKPVVCALTPIARNETSPASRMKALAYLDAVLANDMARQEGAEEALFCNTKGALVCSSLGNLFLRIGDTLVTAPLEDGVLDGITRAFVLKTAAVCGLTPEVRSLDPAELEDGEAFLTNSLRLIAPVTGPGVGKGALGGCLPSPTDRRIVDLMERLCMAIAAECGVDPRERGAVLPAK